MSKSFEIYTPGWAYGSRNVAAASDLYSCTVVRPYPDMAHGTIAYRNVSAVSFMVDNSAYGAGVMSELNAVLERIWAETVLEFFAANLDDPITHYSTICGDGETVLDFKSTSGLDILLISEPENLNTWWSSDFKKYGWATEGADPIWTSPVHWINFTNSRIRWGRDTQQQRIFLQPGCSALVNSISTLLPPQLTYTGWTSGVYPPTP